MIPPSPIPGTMKLRKKTSDKCSSSSSRLHTFNQSIERRDELILARNYSGLPFSNSIASPRSAPSARL